MEGDLSKKSKVGGIAALALAGIVAASTDFVEGWRAEPIQACETYQGRTSNSADGINRYVFDSETLSERQGRTPEYSLEGSSNFKNQLEIGKNYKFNAMNTPFTNYDGELISFEEVENCN